MSEYCDVHTSKTVAQSRCGTTTPPRTPPTTSTIPDQLLVRIQSIHDDLAQVPSLAPGEIVNSLLTRLVDLCIQPYSADCLAQFFSMDNVAELCQSLRSMCARAEGELEAYWASRIIEATKTLAYPASKHLDQFPYYQNYIDLCRLECSALDAFLVSPPTQVAFIGSGSLPLSSICMLNHYTNLQVHNIDRDEPALRKSQDLCGRLGYSMTISCEDVTVGQIPPLPERAASMSNWLSFDVVFLAALVGMNTASKLAILSSLACKLRPGTIIVARSAQGLRSVLYPILDLSDGLDHIGLDILAEIHPWTKVVNSIIILRVREGRKV